VAIWSLQKKFDLSRKPTDAQVDMITSAHTKATSLFRALQIDIDSKPQDQQRLYHIVLLYLDSNEVICPAEMRTASLIAFLATTGSGWTLPPNTEPVSGEFAKEVDGYMAMEIFRNYSGIEAIHNELRGAMARTNAALSDGPH